MPKLKDLKKYFETLAGQKSNCTDNENFDIIIFENGKEIGYSQFNEILLLFGFDRIGENFFEFLASGHWKYGSKSSIRSLTQLNEGINRFSKLALISYGNIKFAYKIFAAQPAILKEKIFKELPNNPELFMERHNPLIEIEEIPANKTFYLGHLIEKEINNQLKENPNDETLKNKNQERLKWVEFGKRNLAAYLASDHLDVYVATSMRLPHEYYAVSKVINQIFKSKTINGLNLRWFDPTQAYCKERIDKGLSEALMLKRASCTLYLAQEVDTLGKDSELASTLAQGKPVIAYIPKGDKEEVDNLIKDLIQHSPNFDEKQILMEQIKIFGRDEIWINKEIRDWIDNIEKISIFEIKNKLYELVHKYYNKRADTLKNDHPLGIQVNLNSGVANGVIVTRKIEECIELIKRVVLSELEFDIFREPEFDPNGYVMLKEKITGSIFRLKTNNQLLSNAFWNFYIK